MKSNDGITQTTPTARTAFFFLRLGWFVSGWQDDLHNMTRRCLVLSFTLRPQGEARLEVYRGHHNSGAVHP